MADLKLEWSKKFLRKFEAAFDSYGYGFAEFYCDGNGNASITVLCEGRSLVFNYSLMQMDDLIADDCELKDDENSNIRHSEFSLSICKDKKAFYARLTTDESLKSIFESMKSVGVILARWIVFCVKNKDGLNAIVGGRQRLAVAMFLHNMFHAGEIMTNKLEEEWKFFFLADGVFWVPIFYMAEVPESLPPLQMSDKLQMLFEAKEIFSQHRERLPAYCALGTEVLSLLRDSEFAFAFKKSDIGDVVGTIYSSICSSLNISNRRGDHFQRFTKHARWDDKTKESLQIRLVFCNYCFCLMALGEGRQSSEGDQMLLENESLLELLKDFQKARQVSYGELMCRHFLVLAGKKEMRAFDGKKKKESATIVNLHDVAKLYWNYFCIVYGSGDAAFLERFNSCIKENKFLSGVFKNKNLSKPFQISRLKLVESLFRVQFKQFQQGKYFGAFDELGKLFPNLLFCHLRQEHFLLNDEEFQKHVRIVFPKTKQSNTSFVSFLDYESKYLNFELAFPLSSKQILSLHFIAEKCRSSQASFHADPLQVLRQSYVKKKLLSANSAPPMSPVAVAVAAASSSPVAVADVGKVADSLSGYLLLGETVANFFFEQQSQSERRVSFITIRTVEQVVKSCKDGNVNENDIQNVVQQIVSKVAALMNEKEPSVIAGCVAAALAKASNEEPTKIIMAAGMGAAKAVFNNRLKPGVNVLDNGLEDAVSAACSVVKMFALDFKDDFPVLAGKVAALVAKDLFKRDSIVISATAATAAFKAAGAKKKLYALGLAAAFETVLGLDFVPALVAYASAAKALNLDEDTMILEVVKAVSKIAKEKSVNWDGCKTALAEAAVKSCSYFGFDKDESWMLAGMLAKKMIEQSDSPPVDKATVYAEAGLAAARAASVLFPQAQLVDLASYAAAAAATAAAKDSDSAVELALISAVFKMLEDSYDPDENEEQLVAARVAACKAAVVAGDSIMKAMDSVAPVAADADFFRISKAVYCAVVVGVAVEKAAEKLKWTDLKRVVEIASKAAASFADSICEIKDFSELACICGAVALNAPHSDYDFFDYLGIAVGVAAKKFGEIGEQIETDVVLIKTGRLALSLCNAEFEVGEEITINSIGLAIAVSLSYLVGNEVDFAIVGLIVAKLVEEQKQFGCPMQAAIKAIIFLGSFWKWKSLDIACAIGRVVAKASTAVQHSCDDIYAFAGSSAFLLSKGVIEEEKEEKKNFISEVGSAVLAVYDEIKDKSELQEFLKKVFCKSISDAMILAGITWNKAWDSQDYKFSPSEKAQKGRFEIAIDHVASFSASFVHSRKLEESDPIDVAASSVMNVLKLCSADMSPFEKVVHVGFGVGFAAKTFAKQIMSSLRKMKERKKWDPVEIISLAVGKALEFADLEKIPKGELQEQIAERVAFYVGHLVLRLDRAKPKESVFDPSDICFQVALQVAKVANLQGSTKQTAIYKGSGKARPCALALHFSDQLSDFEQNAKDEIEKYFKQLAEPEVSSEEVVLSDDEIGAGFYGSAANNSAVVVEVARRGRRSGSSFAPVALPVDDKTKKRGRSKSKKSNANDPGVGGSKSVIVAKNEKVAQPQESKKEKAPKSEGLFRTKKLLLSLSVLHFNVDNDLFTCLYLLRDNAAFVKACDARVCPLLIVDAMDVPNDAIDLLLNALISTRFAIAFPMIVDTRSRPDLISKVLYLGSMQEEFFGTVGFITIVSHRIFANAICVSTLGGLGSIVKEFRLSEFCRKIGAAALEPKNCFLLSKVLNVENYSFQLSSKKNLTFDEPRFEIGNVNLDEFQENLVLSLKKGHFKSALNLKGEAAEEEDEDDEDEEEEDDDDDFVDNGIDQEGVNDDKEFEAEEDVEEAKKGLKKKAKRTEKNSSFIYPPYDDVDEEEEVRDRVKVKKRDLQLVDDGKCLNDIIISFYIKYMEACLSKLSQTNIGKPIPRSLIWSTFLFSQIANGKTGLDKLFRWLKDEWFKNDYIIVPINETFHWYLAIVDLKGKKIFFLDSRQRNDYSLAAEKISSFLDYSFQQKQMNMNVCKFKVEAVKVPRQQNAFDCGVFLLHFLERFLFSSFLREGHNDYSDLFPIKEIAEKRKDLKRILSAFLQNSPDIEKFEEETLKKFCGMLNNAQKRLEEFAKKPLEEFENEQEKSDPQDLSKKRERSEEVEEERVGSGKKHQLADPLEGL